ncbi:unannotated protein [freshwater metagenome]|uniref:Unannotated protein n=1 Tax=freshwater metagenome TaxID=449393 RepID=A0A6J7SK12_9ZZZZ
MRDAAIWKITSTAKNARMINPDSTLAGPTPRFTCTTRDEVHTASVTEPSELVLASGIARSSAALV